MLRYMIPLIFLLSSANSWRNRVPHTKGQVASETQVKFALESEYDGTGPGAKQPEFAYSTYKNLEDALVAYLDDPDTKLPEHEREKAINKLTQIDYGSSLHADKLHKQLKKPVFVHSHFPTVKYFSGNNLQGTGPKNLDGYEPLSNFQVSQKEPFKFQKFQAVKGSPLTLAHYSRDPDLQLAQDQFAHPKYKFSYGVHDKVTGDSKTAEESRDGGFVSGFYSFIDSDGKTRTVHYTADDQLGFRANVHKS